MVVIEFLNGEKESVETISGVFSPWIFDKNSQCFVLESIEGRCEYPKDFVKSIKQIKAD